MDTARRGEGRRPGPLRHVVTRASSCKQTIQSAQRAVSFYLPLRAEAGGERRVISKRHRKEVNKNAKKNSYPEKSFSQRQRSLPGCHLGGLSLEPAVFNLKTPAFERVARFSVECVLGTVSCHQTLDSQKRWSVLFKSSQAHSRCLASETPPPPSLSLLPPTPPSMLQKGYRRFLPAPQVQGGPTLEPKFQIQGTVCVPSTRNKPGRGLARVGGLGGSCPSPPPLI